MRPLDLAVAASVLVTVVAGATSSTHKTTSTTKHTTTTTSRKISSTVKPTVTSKKTTTTTKRVTTTTKKPTSTAKPTTTVKSSSTTRKTSTTTARPSSTTKKTSTTTARPSSTTKKTTSTARSTSSTKTTLKTSTTTQKPSSSTTRATSSSKSSLTSTVKPTSTTRSSTSTKATSTPKSTSSTASPTPTAAARGIRGLSFNDPSLTQPFKNSTDITWAYNWASDVYYPGGWTPNSFDTGLTYVPMLWSAADDLTSIWKGNVEHAIATYDTDAVLTFNEPDGCCWSCGNSCMDVSSAVSAYKTYVEPFAGRVALGAPAVTNGEGSGVGMDYLAQFMGNCTGCTVDFIPLHFYGSVLDPGAFETYVRKAWEAFGLPIWVTEFGTTSGTEQQVLDWLNAVLPWLDSQPYVHRYAYFMDNNHGVPYLLDSSNKTTSIGKLYSL